MIQKLLEHKTAIDADLARMSEGWRKDWQQYPAVTIEVLDSLIGFLNRGGKRVRGALAKESYYLHGGTNEAVAAGAARVIELVQAYLLVMDDIQDNSATRRGGPTVHIQLGQKYSDHYGIAQGLNAEMLANQRSIAELMALPAPDTNKVRAAQLLADDISTTIIGQISDIYNEVAHGQIHHEDIINTMTWKTAYYTFVSPLELGACLAGEERLDARLREYALNAGIAFQISDDILGVFGDSFEVGKSADDDIREGKATLIATHARAHATAAQRQTLRKVMGNPHATTRGCDRVRAIFEATGAHEYAAKLADTYAQAAETALGKNPEQFLVDLVRFAVKRRS